MRVVKSLVLALLALGLLVLGTWFTLRNSQEVSLDLLFIQLPAYSVALWVILSLLCGLVLGWLLLLPNLARHKAQVFSYKRQLKLQQEELHKLRTLSFKNPE